MNIVPGNLYLTRAPITGVLIPVMINKRDIKNTEFNNAFKYTVSSFIFNENNL